MSVCRWEDVLLCISLCRFNENRLHLLQHDWCAWSKTELRVDKNTQSFSGSNSAQFTLCPFPLLLLLLLLLPSRLFLVSCEEVSVERVGARQWRKRRELAESAGSLIKLLFNCAKVEQLGGIGWKTQNLHRFIWNSWGCWRRLWDLHVWDWIKKQDLRRATVVPNIHGRISEALKEGEKGQHGRFDGDIFTSN